MTLYTNAKGDSCVRNWTPDELMAAFKVAEETNDDILYLAVMSEVERRGLRIVDPEEA